MTDADYIERIASPNCPNCRNEAERSSRIPRHVFGPHLKLAPLSVLPIQQDGYSGPRIRRYMSPDYNFNLLSLYFASVEQGQGQGVVRGICFQFSIYHVPDLFFHPLCLLSVLLPLSPSECERPPLVGWVLDMQSPCRKDATAKRSPQGTRTAHREFSPPSICTPPTDSAAAVTVGRTRHVC